jgi:hypothetical protein
MRRVKINYSLLALSYLEVLLWVFCLLSCASAASAGTVNSQCQFEHSTVGLFKTTLGTPVLLPELRTDAAALELARRYEELPSPLRDPPEDVQASLSPRLASLRLQGAGVAGAQGREFASQVPGGSLEPANAATLGPRFLSF